MVLQATKGMVARLTLKHLKNTAPVVCTGIDLIAVDGTTLVFVEVKSSWDGGLGHPEERVGETKQVHLIRAARHYIQQQSRGKDREYRFDVIAVSGGRESEEISHVEDAFRP